MQRYFVSMNDWDEEIINLTGDNYHHLVRVMRSKPGDEVICNHPKGEAAQCEVVEVNKESVKLEVIKWLTTSAELPIHVTIAQGLPKSDKLDYVLQKGTELGASRFIPFKAERSIVIWNEKKSKNRIKRYEKIVKEASEQSHRNCLPSVEKPLSLTHLIEESKSYDVKLFAYEEEVHLKEPYSLVKAFNTLKENDKLIVCVGPEGGFSQEEAIRLRKNGFKSVRLGPRILRTETAATYVLSSLSFYFEEMRSQ